MTEKTIKKKLNLINKCTVYDSILQIPNKHPVYYFFPHYFRMSEQLNPQSQQFPQEVKCIKCKQTYGYPTFDSMCSLCFKKIQQEKEINGKDQIVESPPIDITDQIIEEAKKRPRRFFTITGPKAKTEIKNQTSKQKDKRSSKYKRKIMIVQENQIKVDLTKEKDNQKIILNNRCSQCNKKTGIMGHLCNYCSSDFCSKHRLPQNHSCQKGFLDKIRKIRYLPKVQARKIDDI